MSSHRLIGSVATIAAVATWAIASEPTAQEELEKRYGKYLRAAAQTADKADDVRLARSMAAAARRAEDQISYQSLLCQEAYRLGASHADGYDAAIMAMETLARRLPARRVESLTKVVELRQRQYASADKKYRERAAGYLIEAIVRAARAKEDDGDFGGARVLYARAISIAKVVEYPRLTRLESSLSGLAGRQREATILAGRIRQLRARLASNTKDESARRQLIVLLLIDKNDPAGAKKLLSPMADGQTQVCLPLTDQPVASLSTPDRIAMSQWYRSLAKREPMPVQKAKLLLRARGYVEAALDASGPESLDRVRLAADMAALNDELEKIGRTYEAIETTLPGFWMDLLTIATPGRYNRDMQKLLAADPTRRNTEFRGDANLPVVTEGGYELEIKFRLGDPNSGFAVRLPVARKYTSLFVNDLQTVRKNGKKLYARTEHLRLPDPEQTGYVWTETGVAPEKTHTILVKVQLAADAEDAAVEVFLDGKAHLGWEGETRRIYQPRSYEGLAIYGTHGTATFTGIRLKLIDGTLEKTDVPAPPTRKRPAERPTPPRR